MDTEECDKAWAEFREHAYRIQKTSIGEKLDTLAMMLQEVKTDTGRSADLIPRLLGEDAALQNAPPMDPADMGASDPLAGDDPMMGGDPPMGMDALGAEPMGGEDMMKDETGQIDIPEGDAPVGDAPVPDGGEPPMDMPGEPAPAEGQGDEITDEEIDALLGDVMGDGSEPLPFTDEIGGPPAMGGGSPEVSERAMALIDALKQAAHAAIDSGQPEQVMQWAEVENAITSALSGMVDLTLPVAGSEMGAAPGDSEVPMEGGIPDMGGEAEGETPGDGFVPESEGGHGSDSEPEKGDDEDPASDDGEKEEKEDDKGDDKDTESTKKSADEGITDLPEPPKEPSILEDVEPEAPKVAKSFSEADVFAIPDMRELMKSGGFSARPPEGLGPDGISPLIKSDERISTARNIFDVPMGSKGAKDPDSIVTAHTYESATDVRGTQDPDSIVTAKPIDAVQKEAQWAVPVIRMDTNDHSPLTIADQVSEPEETDDTRGEQEPRSVATAKPAVEGKGDDSEGTKTRLDLPDMDEPVHKAEDNGKYIMTFQEMMALAKGTRPSAMSTMNGDIAPPELGGVRKSQMQSVRMGRGVDPLEVVKADLENFNHYIAQSKF